MLPLRVTLPSLFVVPVSWLGSRNQKKERKRKRERETHTQNTAVSIVVLVRLDVTPPPFCKSATVKQNPNAAIVG